MARLAKSTDSFEAIVPRNGSLSPLPVVAVTATAGSSQKRKDEIARLASSARRRRGGTGRQEPSIALVVGAGVSAGAGIPTGRGWVPLLWRFHCRATIERKHITRVLGGDVVSYKQYGADFRHFAEQTCREVPGYSSEWLAEHPKHYIAEYQCLMGAMSPSAQRDAIASILAACNPRITWPYLRIAQLVQLGYVDSIITTNLDLVLVKSLSLVGIFPAICDFHRAAKLRSSHAGEPQIIFLHGNRNSYNVRNSDHATETYDKALVDFLRSVVNDRTLVVSGYAGWEDGLMRVLREQFADQAEEAPNEVFWCFAGNTPESPPLSHRQVRNVPEAPCEIFFDELANALNLPPPSIVEKPLQYFVELLEQIDQRSPAVKLYRLQDKIGEIVAFEKSKHEAAAFRIVSSARAGRLQNMKAHVHSWLKGGRNLSAENVLALAKLLPPRRFPDSKATQSPREFLLTSALENSRFQKNLSLRAELATILSGPARALINENKWDQAAEICARITSLNPHSADGWVMFGDAQFHLKKYHDAIRSNENALKCSRKNSYAWNNLGACLVAIGDHKRGLSAFRRQIRVDPNNHWVWGNLSALLSNVKYRAEIIRLFKRQIKLTPRIANVWDGLTSHLLEQNSIRTAVHMLRRQTALMPAHSPAWGRLGRALKSAGDLRGAVECIERQLRLDPENWRILPNYAVALWKAGQLDAAADAFARYFENAPDNISALSNDAELAVVQRDFTRFRIRHRQLVSLTKLPADNTVVLAFLRWIIGISGSESEVVSVFDEKSSGAKIDWDFSDIRPVILKLGKQKRATAELLIKLFEKRISRTAFNRALN
jgi:tetratricopeptide (TPR) repeat protein